MAADHIDVKLTLAQVMAWCRQATSHYLSQHWPRSLWPYGVTRLQWVKASIKGPTFSNSFSWMKRFKIWLKFHWNFFLRVQYGPVTMIVPASGHQVRCIPWVQMGTFNKEISFLCGLKFFALNIFCGEYLQSSLHLMLQIWWKPLLWKMCQ